MKGNTRVIETLNSLLADELTAINQYMLHAEMCENWGYQMLYKSIRSQAMAEMNHAEWLIERILFFDGAPTVSRLNPMTIGRNAGEIINNDYKLELEAVTNYNEAVRLAREVGDQGTVDLLTRILKMEEDHVDWAEKQNTLIEQMGMQNYLTNQAEEQQ